MQLQIILNMLRHPLSRKAADDKGLACAGFRV